jgi:hypothetical protein
MDTEMNKKIEEILSSLDGVKRASPPDFFYTRLKAKMEKELVPVAGRRRILYPAYALTALVVILLVNAAVIFTRGDRNNDTASVNEGETLQSIAAEYNINDVSSIYDLNEER